MRPIKEWRLAWFWLLAGGLATAATLAENIVCSAPGCVLPRWTPTLTTILVGVAVFALYLQAVVWRLQQGQTDELRKAWRWWLRYVMVAPPFAAFLVGMAVGFSGPHATHSFDWRAALWMFAGVAVLSGLAFLISLVVRRVIRRIAGVA
jgi:hypothetical protein